MPIHHSDPTPTTHQTYSYYNSTQKPAPLQQHNSYPYATSAPMGYRSYSHETITQRQSPQAHGLSRTPSLQVLASGASVTNHPSPSTSSPYTYQRQPSNGYPASSQQSPQRTNFYPQYYSAPYGQSPVTDLPRSLSYSSAYTQQPYGGNYLPSMSTPSLPTHPTAMPSLARNHTTNGIGEGLAGMDLSRQGPSLGYSFANRLPLVDRPFKCDECVQSFNRNHDLKRHKRIHLSVKPFGCDKCGKTFSRKDALRRHWLVKGCRGEEGATAPITPLFPLNNPPGFSPPSPPSGQEVSPTEASFPPGSYSHSSASMSTLPRQRSDQSSLLTTPNDVPISSESGLPLPLDEPLFLDPAVGGAGSNRSSGSDGQGGYFEGVVGLKQDGTAVIDKAQSHVQNSSPFSRYPTSPSSGIQQGHPYRRPGNLQSPQRGHDGSMSVQRVGSSFGQDIRPTFAMPFPAQSWSSQTEGGMLAPPISGDAVQMEKQASADAAPQNWQRWHRPSFPFPVPSELNYDLDPAGQVALEAHMQVQGYAQ